MRPGQLTPENKNEEVEPFAVWLASMRPGQLTPENGAKKELLTPIIIASMRPGQLTPENVQHLPEHVDLRLRASMRPGQLTPENRRLRMLRLRRSRRFNEAGAINPGKPTGFILHAATTDVLQ